VWEALEAPAVVSPMSRAFTDWTRSLAKVSPAETQSASIMHATGRGIAVIRFWSSSS
jgi:hypothetical protein